MRTIVLSGISMSYNFGSPCLLHGAIQLIHEIDPDVKIVCYQFSKEKKKYEIEGAVICNIEQTPIKVFISAILFKFHIKPKDYYLLEILTTIKSADVVVDIFGISFCGSFSRKVGRLIAIKNVIGKYCICAIGKLLGTISIKATASYGPINSAYNKIQARFASKHIFDKLYAREIESQHQMINIAKVSKSIIVTPDLANFMPYKLDKEYGDCVGISVSYQIIRHWGADESYVECMVKLVEHILDTTDLNVALFPNEYFPDNQYNDIHVANDIFHKVSKNSRLFIVNIQNMSSKDIKNKIAGCSLFIGSRYHACVAALSSQVPIIVIGWHYKYTELLHLYRQDDWILSNENCSSDLLIDKFNNLLNNMFIRKQKIEFHSIEVKKELLKLSREMFFNEGRSN